MKNPFRKPLLPVTFETAMRNSRRTAERCYMVAAFIVIAIIVWLLLS